MRNEPSVTRAEVGRTLELAAGYLDRHGWYQGEWFDHDRRASAEGAIFTMAAGAAGGKAMVGRAALAVLGQECGGDVVRWNDAPERTKAEVIEVMRRAARRAASRAIEG